MKSILSLFLLPTVILAQSWTPMAPFPGALDEQAGFVINGKGYVTGASSALYEYNPASDTWSQKAPFAGIPRNSAAAFSIGSVAYLTTGSSYNDLWAYDQSSDAWSQKASLPGPGREGAVAAISSGKAYVGLGGSYYNDWYEYNPIGDIWTQKAPIPGPGRYHACAFEVNGKIYVVGGFGSGTFYNDVFEYNPATDTWLAKAPFPGTARDRQEGVSLNGKGYMFVGWNGNNTLSDCWEYDAANDSWIQLSPLPTGTYNGVGLSINGSLYCGLGTGGASWSKLSLCAVRSFSIENPLCFGQANGSITLNSPSGTALTSASWINFIPPLFSPVLTGVSAGNYTCVVTDSGGCVTTETVTLTQPSAILASASGINNICNGGNDASICLVVSGGISPYNVVWTGSSDTTFCRDQLDAGNYTASVNDANGCSTQVNYTLIDPPAINTTANVIAATCPTCNDGSASVSINGGNAFFEINWSNGSVGFTNTNLNTGWYSYCVSDTNDCEYCDSVFVGNLLSLDYYEPEEFFIAPNPSAGITNIRTSLSGLMQFELIDISGRNVQTGTFFNQTQIDFSLLENGIYVLRLWGNGTEKRMRLMKE
jgi:N-acetylneuraminic acid mutarotase